MERVYVSFTMQNILTIGLIFLFWYFVICGGWNVYKNMTGSNANS